MRETVSPGSESSTGTSLGSCRSAMGSSASRALLPDPTEQNYHSYGLSSCALTYTGYQLVENLIAWTRA